MLGEGKRRRRGQLQPQQEQPGVLAKTLADGRALSVAFPLGVKDPHQPCDYGLALQPGAVSTSSLVVHGRG